MRPLVALNDNEANDALLILQRTLGEAVRLSYSRMISEPVPSHFALLLVRLAAAEVLRSGPEDECGPCDPCE